MPFYNSPKRAAESPTQFSPPTRPKFNHQITTDRLREGSRHHLSFSMISNIRKDRKSIFKELGLDTEEADVTDHYGSEREFGELTQLSPTTTTTENPSENPYEGGDDIRLRRSSSTSQDTPFQPETSKSDKKSWYSKVVSRRPKIKAVPSATPSTVSAMSRFTMMALIIAVALPGFSYYNGHGVAAGLIRRPSGRYGPILETRADSPTQVCTRWSHQAAMLNGTLYIYGGQAKTSSDQVNNTWNNNFLTLDLTKSWDVSSPALSPLAQPSGPPAVANGYLWNDYNNLYLYGGEFPDNPYVQPAAVSTWQYTIASKAWTQYSNPTTSVGNNSDPGNAPVQRAAEGAGLSVPELGTSWYFGGHLDLSTTQGWSAQVARVYLKSLLEFTHPGYTNDGVSWLASGTGAGDGGVYRNITQGGLQTASGFSERADGVLVFVPGWGEKGVLLGLGGGTATSFSNDLSTLDVYDIANSVWYHQQTTGTPPSVRVNACAVVASAPDASSFQIYLYGGQNLQPYDQQTQYSDMYILSIPSFTWIRVDQGGENMPAARAGHTCSLRDGQIVLVGGYVGTTIPCDSPGIYVFNASSLQWASRFNALDHPSDLSPGNSVQANSFGYQVPPAVASVIGGGSAGGATATTPAAGPATGGPFATGKSPVFTVTASGSTATVTQWGPGSTITGTPPPSSGTPGGGGGSGGENSNAGGPGSSSSPGLVIAGVFAGLAGMVAAYLGFCTWLYRRQVSAYKNHLAVASRYSASSTGLGGFAAFFGRKGSDKSKKGAGAEAEKRGRTHRRDASNSTAGSFTWVPPVEPKSYLDEHPTPESGYSSGSPFPPPGQAGPYGAHPQGWLGVWSSTTASGSGSQPAQPTAENGSGAFSSDNRSPGRRTPSVRSTNSAEGLLEGQEPSFFSVVMGPRRALRVVNGLEGEGEAT